MASGDAIIGISVERLLTPAERTALGTLLAGYWTGALSDLDDVHFERVLGSNDVRVRLYGERTFAPNSIPKTSGCVIKRWVP